MDGDRAVVKAPVVVEGRDAVQMVRHALAHGTDVELDMSDTELLTSEGCQALLQIQSVLAQSGMTVVVRPGQTRIVREVMRITDLASRIPILDEDAERPLEVRS